MTQLLIIQTQRKKILQEFYLIAIMIQMKLIIVRSNLTESSNISETIYLVIISNVTITNRPLLTA